MKFPELKIINGGLMENKEDLIANESQIEFLKACDKAAIELLSEGHTRIPKEFVDTLKKDLDAEKDAGKCDIGTVLRAVEKSLQQKVIFLNVELKRRL